MVIGIPGIPCGNFASVVRMIQKCGGEARFVSQPQELESFDRVIVAGVGAFDYGMASLREGGWVDVLDRMVLQRRVPVLGICLGMQLMCASSEEGSLPGLGWMDAGVKRLRPPPNSGLKIPHMGWNTVKITRPNALLGSDLGQQRFYFVHSYGVACHRAEDVLASAHHGEDFVAAFNRENIYGVQFHPEKSHRFGMAVLRNFVELPC
jgi:imidazole glycerol-phosphate synthase subunit HisH